jgi:hypothetical protein
MALILVAVGLLGAAVTWSGYLFAAVRNVEDLLPDYVQATVPSVGLGA